MRAGLLKEQITIKTPTVTRDSFGGESTTFTSINTLADVHSSNGNRVNENGDIYLSFTKTFEIRMYHTVTEKCLIGYDGREYRIIDINKDKQKLSIIITAELIND